MSEYRYNTTEGEIRVIVAGDVVALPEERWALGNFAGPVSAEWLLGEARLPGRLGRRRMLAVCVCTALHEHYGEVSHGT